MPVNAGFKLNLNPEAKVEIDAAVLSAVEEVFELDIKPEAVRGSPVSKGRMHGGAYVGGGTNRRSIDTETTVDGEGRVVAKIFTQSGYGGYLETGTRKMAARPYIFPAWEKFKNKIAEVTGRKIGAVELKVQR